MGATIQSRIPADARGASIACNGIRGRRGPRVSATARFTHALAAYIAHLNETRGRIALHTGTHGVMLSATPGRAWARVVGLDSSGGRSAIAFVEIATGDIYAPDGWRGPRRNVPRGNIYQFNAAIEAARPWVVTRVGTESSPTTFDRGSGSATVAKFTKEGLESVITRRVSNTGETREQARAAILEITERLNRGELTLNVIGDNGEHLGVRDKNGFRPSS